MFMSHAHLLIAMTSTTLVNRPPFLVTQTLFSSTASSYILRTSSLTFRSTKYTRSPIPSPLRLRCSVAGESAISPSNVSVEDSGPSFAADVVVVGGGISGLCVALTLATKHSNVASNVIVTEARDRAGGNIITVERDGYLWEEGPNSFQPSDPMLTMVMDNGLKDDLVLWDPNAPRFVLWNGKLRPVPSKPTDLPFFDLISIGGKLRAGFGALGIRPSPPVTGS